MPEPDLELLAALLKNPELVFALTSGQAGNLSNEETIKLLDMIKANEMNSLANITASSGKSKPEEKVEVSLPSPTPSSDPVTVRLSRHFVPLYGKFIVKLVPVIFPHLNYTSIASSSVSLADCWML